MAYEKETKTQKFIGTELAEGRKKFLFFNPRKKDPDRVSAFAPYNNLDALEPGHIYTYEQENVPMLDDNKKPTGKFYHNFTRRNGSYGKAANGDFKVDLAESGAIEAFEAKAPKQEAPNQEAPKAYDQTPREAQPQEAKRPGYWDTNLQLLLDRFKLDTEKQPVIVRESCISSAATSLQMTMTPKMTPEQIAMAVIRTAKAYELFCNSGNIVDAEIWLSESAKLRKEEQKKLGDDE
jgi:hypothetical protein